MKGWLDNYPDILLPKEVAKILGISNVTLSRWGKGGVLTESFRLNNNRGDRRYYKKDVIEFIKRRSNNS